MAGSFRGAKLLRFKWSLNAEEDGGQVSKGYDG